MRPFTFFAAILILSVGAGPALAHIALAETQARAGSYHVVVFRVGHGCGELPTVRIRISIPAGIAIARPQPKPGWALSIAKTAERVTAIEWTGRLEADQFDQFAVMLKLPSEPGRLYFPTVQRCVAGENDWTMVPAAGQSDRGLKAPAPMLELMPADPMPAAMDHMRM